MNEARKKALGILNYRASNLEMQAQFANAAGNILGEDADVASAAFAEAARVIRGAIETIEAIERKE